MTGSTTRRGAVGKVAGGVRTAAKLTDSYGLVLALLIVDYVFLSVKWSGGWALVVSAVLIGATAVLAFHTSAAGRLAMRLVRIGAGVGVVAAVFAAASGGEAGRAVAYVCLTLLLAGSPVVILARIIRQTQVSLQTIMGAICVYVLIGLVFAYADQSYQLASGHPFFAQSGHYTSPSFLYFSFITMATVGYGDLTPAFGLPRTLAVLEALTGQIFLVVLVSRLVAMYAPTGRSRLAELREAAEGKGAAEAEDQPTGD